MWNDPGSPWHAQTSAPLLYAYRFLYGAERDRERMDIMWEEEKCFAGQLSKKCPIHYPPPFKTKHSQQGPPLVVVTVLGPADSLDLAGGDLQRVGQWLVGRGHCALCVCVCGGALLESYIQLKTRSRLFSRDMYIRKTRVGVEQTTALCGLCYIHFNHFPFNQSA